jgi:nicotinamide-nucleotide amidase
VTGVAGPSGGTREKPIGLVLLHVETPEAGDAIEFTFPGDRESIRSRATVAALHLLRRQLTRSRDEEA